MALSSEDRSLRLSVSHYHKGFLRIHVDAMFNDVTKENKEIPCVALYVYTLNYDWLFLSFNFLHGSFQCVNAQEEATYANNLSYFIIFITLSW